MEPVPLKSNEFWGKRSGFIDSTKGPIFKGKRAGSAKKSNSGPTGRKARRSGRNYRNLKLARRGGLA